MGCNKSGEVIFFFLFGRMNHVDTLPLHLCVLLSGSFNSLRSETTLWRDGQWSSGSPKSLPVMTTPCLRYTIIHCRLPDISDRFKLLNAVAPSYSPEAFLPQCGACYECCWMTLWMPAAFLVSLVLLLYCINIVILKVYYAAIINITVMLQIYQYNHIIFICSIYIHINDLIPF